MRLGDPVRFSMKSAVTLRRGVLVGSERLRSSAALWESWMYVEEGVRGLVVGVDPDGAVVRVLLHQGMAVWTWASRLEGDDA